MLVLVASLLLLAAMLGVWARSYWRIDLFYNSERRGITVLVSPRGRLVIETQQSNNPIREGPRGWERAAYDAASYSDSLSVSGWRFLGFAYEPTASESWWGRAFAVPYWSLAALLAIVPIHRLVRRLRLRRRRRLSLCLNCGFDLRCSAARCPECRRPVLAGEDTP